VCTSRVGKEFIARVAPLSSTVVCIESIPAYAGVVVRGYLPWCISGSLAGQLRFSQILNFFEGVWGGGVVSVAVYSNDLARAPSGVRQRCKPALFLREGHLRLAGLNC
jgi:hypothetical protein